MSPRYSIVPSSICGHDYTICITQSQIHLFNQHKELQRVPQSSYRRVKTKNVCQPLCISSLNPQVDHQNIHQVDHMNIPLSPQIVCTNKNYLYLIGGCRFSRQPNRSTFEHSFSKQLCVHLIISV